MRGLVELDNYEITKILDGYNFDNSKLWFAEAEFDFRI